MKKFWRDRKAHLICWSVFIFLEVVVAAAISGRFSSTAYYVLFYALNISLFYFNALVVMPCIPKGKVYGYWRFWILLILEISLYICLAMFISVLLQYIYHTSSYKPSFDKRYFASILWRGSFFMAYSIGYYYLRAYLKKENRKANERIDLEVLKNQLLVAESNYLRAQINPHLLFNTLSFIKYATKKDPKLAEEAVLRFSEIMTYALSGEQKHLENLDKEVSQINNIIGLNRLRFGNNFYLNYSADINYNHTIPPIILLTLVENLFKHGNFQDKDDPSEISISADRNKLSFVTRNLISQNSSSEDKHIGLSNILLRLDSAYQGKYKFEYGQQGRFFITKLEIDFI